jgi:hypothetical protein
MNKRLMRHVSGAVVWFPNKGRTGVVVKSGGAWRVGQTFSHWPIDSLVDDDDYEIVFKIKKR